tara:strand:+ start:2733 stop:2879 length:147 start_codon:yes stop_codon:yes gene_type:complete
LIKSKKRKNSSKVIHTYTCPDTNKKFRLIEEEIDYEDIFFDKVVEIYR